MLRKLLLRSDLLSWKDKTEIAILSNSDYWLWRCYMLPLTVDIPDVSIKIAKFVKWSHSQVIFPFSVDISQHPSLDHPPPRVFLKNKKLRWCSLASHPTAYDKHWIRFILAAIKVLDAKGDCTVQDIILPWVLTLCWEEKGLTAPQIWQPQVKFMFSLSTF